MLWVVLVALAFDAIIGDPDWLWRRVPHPVALIGRVIAMLDRSLNREAWSASARRIAGVGAVIVLVAVAVVIGIAIEILLGQSIVATLVQGLIASMLIAQRSLYQHVARVRDEFVRNLIGPEQSAGVQGTSPRRGEVGSADRREALSATIRVRGDGSIEKCLPPHPDPLPRGERESAADDDRRHRLNAARRAVAMIVGRDPDVLDEPAVCRAAIESCAENFSDGIVAPVFWLALLGLPGLIAYKAINTADSMIGHRNARYENFGWAAARLDDVVNLIPARLSGLLIALVAPLASGSIATSMTIMLRDARSHRSPNAGWPESAMAAALGLALAGPRRYGESVVDDAFLNASGRQTATSNDIGRALKLFAAACVLQVALYLALAIVV